MSQMDSQIVLTVIVKYVQLAVEETDVLVLDVALMVELVLVQLSTVLELMELAQPLLKPVVFGNKIDFIWFELWHHEGRRARHGVSMMGPDYTHWHGMYDVAKNFYTEFIPELEALVEKYLLSKEPSQVEQAKRLQEWLNKVLTSNNHKWFVN